MNTEAITGRSMFGMHKGTQGIHLRLRLTACDIKKNETSPLMSATSITKQSAWICFTACVVVTSDTMSSTPEFQRDSVSDGWITGRPNLTTFVLVLFKNPHVVVASFIVCGASFCFTGRATHYRES